MIENSLDIVQRLEGNRQGAWDYRERRHPDWTENYQLYRDKIITNRLTQRQSVNVPLMKETIKTILARIDEAPDLSFEEKSNDKEKEIYINEFWKHTAEQNKLEVKDIADKKQVLLYGKSWKKLGIDNGAFFFEVLDPFDVLIDRYTDPTDFDATCGFLIHTRIYRSLDQIEANPWYDKDAVARLKAKMTTAEGLIKSAENVQDMTERNERLQTMGDDTVNNPTLGRLVVEINEHYCKHEGEIYLYVLADGELLMSKPLEEVIGKTKDEYWKTHYPFVTWSEDVERSDNYPDGVGDIVRTPNKVLNAWFSQLVENRVLRNFGMQFYDVTANDNFIPTTYDPVPFGWYPVPGKPKDVIQRVDIPDLSESIDEMTMVINMVERATAATATEKGVQNKGQVTLGEIKLIAERALERITSIAKFYRISWKEFGQKWVKMLDASADQLEAVPLFKKGYRGNYFKQDVGPKDFVSEEGYDCRVLSSAEREQKQYDTIQKLDLVVQKFPGNIALQKIYEAKLLELADLNPEEIREVTEYQDQVRGSAETATGGAPTAPGPQVPGTAPSAAPRTTQPSPGAVQGRQVPQAFPQARSAVPLA